MANTTTTKAVMSLVATTSSKIRDLTIKNGQLVFLYDIGRIAFDYKDQRVFYNQIVELDTETERQSLASPLSGYYFVIDEACLWHYQDGWIQITEKPKEIIFIGVELPELGQANKLYIDKLNKKISIWDEETNGYIIVSEKNEETVCEELNRDFIDSLFK